MTSGGCVLLIVPTLELEEVFERLEQAELRLKASKYFLFRKEVEFLGHLVTPHGVQTDPAKVTKVTEWRRPTTVEDVRAFLGLCGYYHRFMDGFAANASPFHALTKMGRGFEWTERCTVASERLKELLTSAPVLAYPDFQHLFRMLMLAEWGWGLFCLRRSMV